MIFDFLQNVRPNRPGFREIKITISSDPCHVCRTPFNYFAMEGALSEVYYADLEEAAKFTCFDVNFAASSKIRRLLLSSKIERRTKEIQL